MGLRPLKLFSICVTRATRGLDKARLELVDKVCHQMLASEARVGHEARAGRWLRPSGAEPGSGQCSQQSRDVNDMLSPVIALMINLQNTYLEREKNVTFLLT